MAGRRRVRCSVVRIGKPDSKQAGEVCLRGGGSADPDECGQKRLPFAAFGACKLLVREPLIRKMGCGGGFALAWTYCALLVAGRAGAWVAHVAELVIATAGWGNFRAGDHQAAGCFREPARLTLLRRRPICHRCPRGKARSANPILSPT